MKNYYCPDCGYKNVYQLDKPKFCGSCGKEMERVKIARYDPPATSSRKSFPMDDFEIVSDNYQEKRSSFSSSSKRNPFSADSITLTASGPNVQTLDQIMKSSAGSQNVDEFERPKDTRSKDEILQEFKREASSRSESKEVQ